MILLDTHVLLWLVGASPRLGRHTKQRINKEYEQGQVAVSAISFWETAMLVKKGRIRLSRPIDVWRDELLEAGVVEHALNGRSAVLAGQLSDFHGDPADRFIVATALELGAILATADRRILSWQGALQLIDAGA